MNAKAQVKVRQADSTPPQAKTLGNVDSKTAKANVQDVQFYGDPNMFKLMCKASSQSQGWMKSTKGMAVAQVGVVVQTTTQQRNADGTNAIAEATVFVPGVRLVDDLDDNGKVTGRKLQHI